MNVTINGYLTFHCNSCRKPHTLESSSYKFEEDVSEEAENDEYIRYLSVIDTRCPVCSSRMRVKVDVWEFPEAVVNYCYYDEEGIGDIQCEFTIEHYFDAQAAQEEDAPDEQPDEIDIRHEYDPDDEEAQQADASIEIYMDRYDDDD